MYRSFVSLVRIRVACRRGRRCGWQGLPRFRLRRYEIIRNLRMPDRARSAFLLKNLKYLGRVRLDSVRTGRAALAGRKDMASAGFDASRHSRPVRRFLLPAEREGARRLSGRSGRARRGSGRFGHDRLWGSRSVAWPQPRCPKVDRAPYGCRPDKKSRPVVGNPD